MEYVGYTGLDTGICALGHRRKEGEREKKEGRKGGGERGRA